MSPFITRPVSFNNVTQARSWVSWWRGWWPSSDDPRFCSVQAAKTERRQLQCDRGSGSIGHRLASSPPRRGASQLLQLLYGDDHTAAGTRAPFRGFQGALARQLRSGIKHGRPCTSQEASSTQIFCGLAPQPNCSGAAHDLKVIKEDAVRTGVGGMGMAGTGCQLPTNLQPHWRSR